MKTFDLVREEKIIVWKRYWVNIEAKTEKEAAKKLLENENFTPYNEEVLFETEEIMPVSENDDQNTIEIFNGGKFLIGNGTSN
jgi:hypothetical protein